MEMGGDGMIEGEREEKESDKTSEERTEEVE